MEIETYIINGISKCRIFVVNSLSDVSFHQEVYTTFSDHKLRGK